jgi:isopentenyl-diphosphate Delta-isomerase
VSAPAVEHVPVAGAEQVVLLGADRTPVGTADKETVHTADTPLHLAFSCYAGDGAGRLLLTRRAVTKATWPGVWTNTVCGHPGPGEAPEDAVARRARQELGLRLRSLTLVLPDFAYRATDASGVVENEFCPVWTAVVEGDPQPDPAEVAEWRWVEWEEAQEVATRAPWALSPWAVLQLPLLAAARA